MPSILFGVMSHEIKKSPLVKIFSVSSSNFPVTSFENKIFPTVISSELAKISSESEINSAFASIAPIVVFPQRLTPI